MPRAKKSLGQNFLVDPNIQRKIVDAIDPHAGDTIVEIGPGTGALTRSIAASGARLFAIEKDDALADALRHELDHVPSVTIVHGDALRIDLHSIEPQQPVKVVGNIPYNITTPLIFHLLEPGRRPIDIVLMVQREVADRIIAPAGAKTYGALSVGVRSIAAVERLFHVGRNAFRPVPAVDSTVIRITPGQPPPLAPDEERDLRALTRITFSRRRKQMQTILRTAPEYALASDDVAAVLHEVGVPADARPETVDPLHFVMLSRALRRRGLPVPSGHEGDHD